ncbi:MAG: methylenetetrahydrofolate reductase [Alphaproteobacteria bacterium]
MTGAPTATGNALADAFAAGRFAVTVEVAPPASADPEHLIERVRPLVGRVDAINLTDGAGARAAMASLAAAALVRGAGAEPVMQMTCRDRNRIAIQSDILGAAALGIRNILVLHGDDPATGDQPDARPVWDYDSRAVMTAVRGMRDDGTLPSGRALAAAPAMLIGCADTPTDPPPGWHPGGLAAKADAGADFVQTQFCFELAAARRYMAALVDAGLTERLKVVLGVGPIASARSARWMNDNLFGVSVPDAWIDRLDRSDDPSGEGVAMCAELIAGLSEIDGVAGVHIMAPVGGTAAVMRVLDRLDA